MGLMQTFITQKQVDLQELPVENSVIEHSMAEINGQTITVHI